MDADGVNSLQDVSSSAVLEGMKKKIIISVATLATVCLAIFIQHKQHESAEICRVFRELGHARTIIYLDEIDVQDCPPDFRRAYSDYVMEVRSAGLFASSKKMAFARLQDTARSHGVTFTPERRLNCQYRITVNGASNQRPLKSNCMRGGSNPPSTQNSSLRPRSRLNTSSNIWTSRPTMP